MSCLPSIGGGSTGYSHLYLHSEEAVSMTLAHRTHDRIRKQSGAEALEHLDPDQLMHPSSVAEAYWQLYRQPRDAWTFELDMRPYREVW